MEPDRSKCREWALDSISNGCMGSNDNVFYTLEIVCLVLDHIQPQLQVVLCITREHKMGFLRAIKDIMMMKRILRLSSVRNGRKEE